MEQLRPCTGPFHGSDGGESKLREGIRSQESDLLFLGDFVLPRVSKVEHVMHPDVNDLVADESVESCTDQSSVMASQAKTQSFNIDNTLSGHSD